MKSLINYAKSYAEHGFSVLPIGQNKQPLVRFANKPAFTPEELEAMWARWPTASIALRTVDHLVIDVDVGHSDVNGIDSIKEAGISKYLKNTLAERTKSGGYHFYFRKPRNKQIAQDINFLPSVDIKAHINNYTVCAPTPGYKWLNHNPIQPLPEDLLELILSKQGQRKRATVNGKSYKIDSRTLTAMLFEEIVDGLGPTGGRNNALASFIGSLLYRNVAPEKVLKLAQIANENTEDKLSDNEVITTFNSMLGKEILRREGKNGGNSQ